MHAVRAISKSAELISGVVFLLMGQITVIAMFTRCLKCIACVSHEPTIPAILLELPIIEIGKTALGFPFLLTHPYFSLISSSNFSFVRHAVFDQER